MTQAQEVLMYDIRRADREKDGTVILYKKNYSVLKSLERKGLIEIVRHYYMYNTIKVL